MLVLLLLRAGEVVSSERLVDELWGARSPATAAATLQVYVSRLRKALPDATLLTQGRGFAAAIVGALPASASADVVVEGPYVTGASFQNCQVNT